MENIIVTKEDVVKEELLRSIAKHRNNYFEFIKNSSFSKSYESILNIINDISKNTSPLKINQLIEEIKQYIYINEDEPLNKIKSLIFDYNKNIQKNLPKDIIINEKLFINQILIITEDIIGYHIYYFVSKIFEKCDDIFSYKERYIKIKEDLFKIFQNLEKEFLKMKKDNEIDFDLSEDQKENLLKIIKEFKNHYKSMIENKKKSFEDLKNVIHSSCLFEEFFEFCNKYLLNFEDYENKFSKIKNIFPLIYYFKSYIKEKKYDFLIYKNNIENTNSEKKISLFNSYNLFKTKNDGPDKRKKCIELIEENEKEINNILNKFELDINIKCDLINFMKEKPIYESSFDFIPQIEIKFNDVKDITKDLIDDLKLKLNQLFQGKEIKIIKMRKGSLDLAISLNYLIQEQLNNPDILNVSTEKFFEILNETLNIKVGDITNMIKDNLVIAQKDKDFKPNFVNENILDLTSDKEKKKLAESIKKHYSKVDNQNNIFEVSKNITPEDIKTFFENLFKETKNQQDYLCDMIINNDLQEYLGFFESEFEKALQNSIFEYNTKFIAYIYRNDEEYRAGKLHCNNYKKKIVFHGSKSLYISKILATQFRHAYTHYFGEGVYFTDLLDYAWFYAAETKNDNYKYGNVGRIPKVKDSFSFIASEIYYDNSKFEQVYDTEKENEIVPKNGVRHICVGYKGQPISKQDLKNYKGFIGTEYVITNQEQILPLLNVTLERVEYLIVWRDNNFNASNPNNYDFFDDMLDWNNKIKKYAAFNLKTKIYYFNETDEALNFISRKKYNKIILVSNGGNNGIGFINDARKIIGKNTISLITCYRADYYMDVIKKTDNILLNSKYYNCIKPFLDFATNENIDKLKNLQREVENKLKFFDDTFCFKPINQDAFNFPNFRANGFFKDLLFEDVSKLEKVVSQDFNGVQTKDSEGGQFDGFFANLLITGHGMVFFQSGNRYIGDLVNGKKEGKGTFIYADGSSYDGSWKNDKKEGKGIFYFNDGTRYEGNWKNNMMEGEGIIYYNNGEIEIGKYVAGNKIGEHIKIRPNGVIISQVYAVKDATKENGNEEVKEGSNEKEKEKEKGKEKVKERETGKKEKEKK